jgi:hypothetical protein
MPAPKLIIYGRIVKGVFILLVGFVIILPLVKLFNLVKSFCIPRQNLLKETNYYPSQPAREGKMKQSNHEKENKQKLGLTLYEYLSIEIPLKVLRIIGLTLLIWWIIDTFLIN